MAADQAQPHSVEAEQAVIGGLLLQSSAFPRIASLKCEDFYRPDHRLIYAAIASLAETGQGFDIVILEDELKRRGQLDQVGGFPYLATLQRDTPGVSNLEIYADTVSGYALHRRLIHFGQQVVRDASAPGQAAADILSGAQQRLLKLQSLSRNGTGLISASDLTGDLIDDIDRRRDSSHGLRTGLADFDQLTNGLEPGDLIVLAGRPGFGKTTVLVTVGAHVAQDQSVAIFSAEMPALQLMRRCVALLTGITQGKLRKASELTDDDWAQISTAASELASRRLWIDDTSAPTLAHIRSESLALKARNGLGLVIVDYLQLMRGAGRNRYEELRDIAYGLKALAKDLAVPVIALAQLNRGVESRSREDKRPNASDLRDSGGIEEASDIVGLLFSAWQYDPEFPMPDVIELNIVKHRNGARGQCLWSMNGAQSRVTVLDAGDAHQYRLVLRKQQSNRGGQNDL